jgi:hypothetical protein
MVPWVRAFSYRLGVAYFSSLISIVRKCTFEFPLQMRRITPDLAARKSTASAFNTNRSRILTS